MTEKGISKKELSERIWGKISETIHRLNLSQVELEEMCRQKGYRVSQPEISRLTSGKSQLSLYQAIALSDVLDIPLDQMVGVKSSKKSTIISGGSFVTEPTDKAFEGYLGTFYTVFHSTEVYSDEYLHGKLVFSQMNGNKICGAIFELNTGVKDQNGHDIIKRYHGQLIISIRQRTGYCILVNERMGEICSLEFRHRDFFVKKMQCRLALVLTVTAGEIKHPVAHKMLLSRQVITPSILREVGPFLKFRDGDIRISLDAINEIKNKNDESSLGFDFSELKFQGEQIGVLSEADIKKVKRKLSSIQLVKIVSRLLENSEEAFLHGVCESEDSQVYEIFRGVNVDDK